MIDVGSVKVVPSAAMASTLGERIPWIGTHPLFGPSSLALAERPMRVVLCPNAMHPSAVARARAFYERLGCWTIEQDATAHDKAMAETPRARVLRREGHARCPGVDTRVPFAPPSFQAIARTVDVKRGDAGHLFVAICADNPHAGDARRRLLDALEAVHAAARMHPRAMRVAIIARFDRRDATFAGARRHARPLSTSSIKSWSRCSRVAPSSRAVR